MPVFSSLYNLVSVLIYGASLGICSFTYGSTKRKELQYAGLMMFACICDSVYIITQNLLEFRYSTHALVLTAALVLTLAKIYFLDKIIAAVFEKDVSPEFYILLCIIVIIHGLFSTYPRELYWQLDPISFYVSILIICGSYWYSLVQETDAVRWQNASKYKTIVLMMLISSILMLLYIVANLCLLKTVLSQSRIDLYTNFLLLILSVWYIVFCQGELRDHTDEEIENIVQEHFREFNALEQEPCPAAFSKQYAAFFKQYELTEREAEILQLILSGKSNQEISDLLYIAVGTVKTHVHSIFSKLEVSRRSQLMMRFTNYEMNGQQWQDIT